MVPLFDLFDMVQDARAIRLIENSTRFSIHDSA